MKVFQKKFLQPALRSRGARAGFELAERSSSSLTSSCSAPRDKSSDSRASFSVWLGSESSSAKKYLASSLGRRERKREREHDYSSATWGSLCALALRPGQQHSSAGDGELHLPSSSAQPAAAPKQPWLQNKAEQKSTDIYLVC